MDTQRRYISKEVIRAIDVKSICCNDSGKWKIGISYPKIYLVQQVFFSLKLNKISTGFVKDSIIVKFTS